MSNTFVQGGEEFSRGVLLPLCTPWLRAWIGLNCVFLRTLGAIFLNSNHVGPQFFPNFQGFSPDFQRFCTTFLRFFPNYCQSKTFRDALAPPAHPSPTPLTVMESRDLVSVSRPIFAILSLEGLRSRRGLEGYRSRDFEYCEEMV